jgi:hypothetical protein
MKSGEEGLTLRVLELTFNGLSCKSDDLAGKMTRITKICEAAGWINRTSVNGLFTLTDAGRAELLRRAPWYNKLKSFAEV